MNKDSSLLISFLNAISSSVANEMSEVIEKYGESKLIEMNKRDGEEGVEVIDRMITERLQERFVDYLSNEYECFKHENFYTKGIIYDSVDRKLSRIVNESVRLGNYAHFNIGNNSLGVFIDGERTTVDIILKTIVDGETSEAKMVVELISPGVQCPKINKQTFEALMRALVVRLSEDTQDD